MTSMSSTRAVTLLVVGLFLLTWVVMMVAMMFPAVSPVVVTFDRWVRRTQRSRGATVVFVAGYLLVWTVSGLVVYSALVHLEPLLPFGKGALRSDGGLLVLAGGYQLTPLKQMCLRIVDRRWRSLLSTPFNFAAEALARAKSESFMAFTAWAAAGR
jgi:predicted metal-binding membrane protein